MSYALLKDYDTAEISDALDACGVEGALLGIKPLASGMKVVGPVFTVKYSAYNQDKGQAFKSAGDYIDEVPEGSVILIDNDGRQDCTTWGDILTQMAVLKNIAGTVVNGVVRDVEFIKNIRYPTYSLSTYMRSGKNRVYKSNQQCQLNINGVTISPGDILAADDNGVVVVPICLVEEVIMKASNIKRTELDIIAAVKAGARLDDARKLHRYDQPWLQAEEKK